MCFPFAAQAARLNQRVSGRKPETVWLLTSRKEEHLCATQWLASRRDYWGIENGMHQRLDVSASEDASRVRTQNAVWVLGMFRRLSVSLFVEWRSRDPCRKWTTMTDFHAYMRRENQRRGFSLITSKRTALSAK
jgi:hypothetical protein